MPASGPAETRRRRRDALQQQRRSLGRRRRGGDDKKGGGRGPWGGGDGGGGGGPGGQPPVPDIDEIVRKGQEQLKILMGGRGGGGRARAAAAAAAASASAGAALMIARRLLVGFWLLMSVYTVRPEEQSVELTFGECRGDCIGKPGLNFAPWPIVTHEIVQVTRENTEEIGSGTVRGASAGLMLTGDENIVDITFQVVWNVRDPTEFLFNLSDPTSTIQAVAESAMREVVSRSELSPILSRDRGVISQEVQELIQATLDEYGSGVNIVRVNFDKADPPQEVIDAFREVQAARQERSTPAEPRRRLRQPDARRGARQRGAAAAGGRGLPRPGGQRRPGRGQPLHRRAAGVRQGARGDAPAALPRDDGERARRRADVPARHALGRRAGRSCPTCR